MYDAIFSQTIQKFLLISNLCLFFILSYETNKIKFPLKKKKRNFVMSKIILLIILVILFMLSTKSSNNEDLKKELLEMRNRVMKLENILKFFYRIDGKGLDTFEDYLDDLENAITEEEFHDKDTIMHSKER